MSGPQTGERAPDATLLDQAGQPYLLSQAWTSGPACLVFYPGDFTRVCTAQLCDYRDRWDEFSAIGTTVVGINPASHGRHSEFAAAHGFPFPLLSDGDGSCCAAYLADAWWGTRRLVVVIDREGIIRYRRAVMPFRRQSADDLLTALRACTVGDRRHTGDANKS
jgi:thioredoxin-dependent peroxiredoxin